MSDSAAAALRIVSLIPSATEIVAGLGLLDQLVGRSHECDYPPEVEALPICTAPKFNPQGTSAEIHDRVTQLLQSALSVYQINTEVLAQLQPTHILTQAQCDVCAVSLVDVAQAVATLTQDPPQIFSLQPRTLEEVWSDIRQVAEQLQVDATPLLEDLQYRVQECSRYTQGLSERDRPTTVCIEWTEPLMDAGNWIPELVTLAGGKPLFGSVGEHSGRINWADLVAADPEVIIFMPCGYDLERTRQDALSLTQRPEWPTLQAVEQGRVYITDGNQYFNRPGPRLVDSLEILTEILHPEFFTFGYEGAGWDYLLP